MFDFLFLFAIGVPFAMLVVAWVAWEVLKLVLNDADYLDIIGGHVASSALAGGAVAAFFGTQSNSVSMFVFAAVWYFGITYLAKTMRMRSRKLQKKLDNKSMTP